MASPEAAGPATSAVRARINDPSKVHTMAQSIVYYQDSEELENSRLQRLWNENMERAYANPSGYRRISVMLISWDEALDDLKTKDEVCFHTVTHDLRLACSKVNRLTNWELSFVINTTTEQQVSE